MKAAKQPPTEAARQEASIVVDIVQRWKDDDHDISNKRPIVMRCKVCAAEYPAGATACQKCAATMLFAGAAPVLEEEEHESESELVWRVVIGAVAEYLRRHPRARSDVRPYAFHRDDSDDDIPAPQRDWNVVCLFCRKDVNSIGAGKRVPKGGVFWTTIQKHTWLCAAMYLAGMISPIKSPKRSEDRLPVSKLKGGDLFAAAVAAAQYMEVPEPTPRKRGSGNVCTGAYWQRRMVADARKLADARMRLERDGGRSQERYNAEQAEIERLLFNIDSLYRPLCLKSMGCLCAWHARGNPPTEACDARESRRG